MPPERQVVGFGGPNASVSDRAVLSFWTIDGKLKDSKQSYVSYAMVGTLYTGIHNINCSKTFTFFSGTNHHPQMLRHLQERT
jgi:hypothetical protein